MMVNSLLFVGDFQPSDEDKLKFYGLYKQVTEGPNTTAQPWFWDITARAKWDAWTSRKDLSKEQAMEMYVQALEQMIDNRPQSKETDDIRKAIAK
jgi:acyl-CoA-binding protein